MEMIYAGLVLVAMAFIAICYVITLYHRAHGREAIAMQIGADVVIVALSRRGDIAQTQVADAPPDHPVNLGEEPDYGDDEEQGSLADILVARSDRAAQQLQERELNNLMEAMDEKV